MSDEAIAARAREYVGSQRALFRDSVYVFDAADLADFAALEVQRERVRICESLKTLPRVGLRSALRAILGVAK